MGLRLFTRLGVLALQTSIVLMMRWETFWRRLPGSSFYKASHYDLSSTTCHYGRYWSEDSKMVVCASEPCYLTHVATLREHAGQSKKLSKEGKSTLRTQKSSRSHKPLWTSNER